MPLPVELDELTVVVVVVVADVELVVLGTPPMPVALDVMPPAPPTAAPDDDVTPGPLDDIVVVPGSG